MSGAIHLAGTIRDIARQAGVSPTTVSQVLNNKGNFREETRRLVLDTAAKLGYAKELPIARQLKRIAILFPTHLQSGLSSNELYQEIYEAITFRLPESVSVMTLPNDLELFPLKSALANRQIDAAIAFGASVDHPTFERLAELGIPALAVLREAERSTLNWVSIDHEKAAFDATSHLIALGHRNIAFVIHRDNTGYMDARVRGFSQALASAGIEADESHVLIQTPADGQKLVNSLFQLDPLPTAVFASPDSLAVDIVKRANELGYSVPSDLSIVGFDDLACASTCDPPLTTIGFSKELAGELAVDLLFWAYEKQLVSLGARIPHELIVRGSTTAAATRK